MNKQNIKRNCKRCVICGIRRAPRSGVFLARIPLDPVRSRMWVKAIGQEDLVYLPIEKLHELKYVCDKHFQSSDFNTSKTRLLKDAVPSLNLNSNPLQDEMLIDFPQRIGQHPMTNTDIHSSSAVAHQGKIDLLPESQNENLDSIENSSQVATSVASSDEFDSPISPSTSTMSNDSEIQVYFGRCRCCLIYGYFKNMWMEHDYDGNTEIYGDMLVNCFSLSLEKSDHSMHLDQICDQCILRLRDSSRFKKLVLESQDILKKQADEDNMIKIETLSEHSDEEAFLNISNQSDDPGTNSGSGEIKYEEIEFLEDDETDSKTNTKEMDVTESNASQPQNVTTEPGKKRKWPKKLPKSERYKSYKQYSAEDLRKCLDAVQNEEMTVQEASERFKIPKKTIAGRIRKHKCYGEPEPDPNKEKTFNFIQEIKTILTYTNATPFKSKANRFYCAYCTSESALYENPDDLRTHSRTVHVSDRTSKIEFAMRPYWINEIFRIDIENFLCNICCVPIVSWNDMFKHLRQQHQVTLDQAYSRVIPYVLQDGMKCCLCKQPFSNYMLLDAHMNSHYDNYICDDCGDTFVTNYRLRQHCKIHDVGRFPCKYCSKIFALEKYRRKHIQLVHELSTKFKCMYCNEKFVTEYARHLHVCDQHNEKVTVTTCELCGKSFTWKPYFLAHMRKKHGKRNAPVRPRTSDVSAQKRDHKVHTAGRSMYVCGMCQEVYYCLTSLEEHLKIHENEETNE